MKVWIVEGNDYEDQAVRAVCATLDIAMAEMRRRKMADPWDTGLVVEEYDMIGEPEVQYGVDYCGEMNEFDTIDRADKDLGHRPYQEDQTFYRRRRPEPWEPIPEDEAKRLLNKAWGLDDTD